MRIVILAALIVCISIVNAYPYLYESFIAGGNIYCIDISKDASAIGVGTAEGKFYLLNQDLRIVRVRSFDSGIVRVGVSDKCYALATMDGKLEIRRDDELYLINLEKAVNCLDVSYNCDVLVCHGDNLTFFVEGKKYWSKEISPRDAALSYDSMYIAVATRDGNISLYKKDGSLIWKKGIKGVKKVAISEDGGYIALCTEDKLYLFDRNGNLLYEKELKDIKDLEITRDGNYILCTLKNKLVYFDRFFHELWEYKAHGIEDTAISGKGDIISVAYWNGSIEVYNNTKKLKSLKSEEIAKKLENKSKIIEKKEEKNIELKNLISMTIGIILLILIILIFYKIKRRG